MTDRLELAARIEAAEGPDFELDCAIAIVSGRYVREKRGRDRQEWFYSTDPKEYHRRNSNPYTSYYNRLPRFTASIDAALTLVPEGWSWSIGDFRGYNPPLWRAHLRDHRRESLSVEGHAVIWKEGNTVHGPALAICAAALRAGGCHD